MIKIFIFFLTLFSFLLSNAQHIEKINAFPEVGIWKMFEIELENPTNYNDPFRDVVLKAEFTHKLGRKIDFWGFYDGDKTWKVRFMPDETGRWDYKIGFSDGSNEKSGSFICTSSDVPGQVNKYEFNPFWLGYKGGNYQLFRSFHVGDRFFAQNWDNPLDSTDGNKRTAFLDWAQEQGYNMLSIASHYLNRNENGRGEGWDTPELWPLNPEEYRKMEIILDELNNRNVVAFPFAGFFGAKGNWPVNQEDQELYITYTLARIGHYPNIILSVAGPEPFWRKHRSQYQGAMRFNDIKRLGAFIDRHNAHGQILTVHNEKRATEFGDPFVDEPWYDMNTLQGPTTVDRADLYQGLAMNHHRYKPLYAQETLWTGNKWHPDYSDDQLRKNAYIILFSGALLNFADMDGNSSTGFSGTLELNDRDQKRHDIVKRVWDWFETIPFHLMTTRQDLVKNGYCLAKEGEAYYIYADTLGEVELFVDFPYPMDSEWINAKNPGDVRPGPTITEEMKIKTPDDGDDWILHAYAPRPGVIAKGNFPDLTVESNGNIHVVYNRDGLKYKKYSQSSKTWSPEESPGCNCKNVKRSDPDIVVDSHGNPHVFCGTEFASWNGKKWVKIDPGVQRDTELIIDKKDNIYLCHRQGNNGGFIGLKKLAKDTKGWVPVTDPDQKNFGKNNHVYPDMWAGDNNVIHLVQRHGPEVEITYRASFDKGSTWPVEMPVSSDRVESAHITVDHENTVYITTGSGFFYELKENEWDSKGRKIKSESRMQPEMTVDDQNNIYISRFGGRFNIRYKDVWMGENQVQPVTNAETIGFVETVGYKDYAVVIWEEGSGGPDQGLENASVIVGFMYPDGRIIGLH